MPSNSNNRYVPPQDYLDGFEASQTGLALTDNPFDPHGVDRQRFFDWRFGWLSFALWYEEPV